MKRTKVFSIIAGLFLTIAVSYAACAQIYASGTWRYKMTVTVETPEGIKTGSAVHEVSNSADNTKFLKFPDSKNIPEFKGEAVVVDLGERGLLFALLKTNPYEVFYDAFPTTGAATVDGIRYYNTLKRGARATLTSQQYPMMVTFTDINDPKSVTLVYGARFDPLTQKFIPVNDFEKIFGHGVKLKDITIEMTDESIKMMIEKHLGWLPNVKKGSLDGSLTNNSNELSNILHYGYFKRGE